MHGEEEGYEEEAGEESEMEGGEMEDGEESGVVIKEMQVPADKEEAIKKKLMELGKMLASIK
jgi:hypothetical protein